MRRVRRSLPTDSQQPSLPIGDMQIYDNYQPTMKSGHYQITVTQTLTQDAEQKVTIPTNPKDIPTTSQDFIVAGPRFSIDPEDIHAMQPTPNTAGHFDKQLPNVIFTKRALPWERAFNHDKDKGDEEKPWLALIVLQPEEIINAAKQSQQQTVAQVLTEEMDTIKPQIDVKLLTPTESSHICSTVKIPVEIFHKIMPTKEEIHYLSHVRQIHTGDKAALGLKDNGWFSILFTNRFPIPKDDNHSGRNVVHVVSLEGLEQYLIEDANFSGKLFIQLFSLASWSFDCLPDVNASFKEITAKLLDEDQADKPPHLLRLQQDFSSAIPANVAARIKDGYVPLLQTLITGEKTLGWYRGPFSPVVVPSLNLKQQFISSSGWLVSETENSMFDVSYTSAWEIGRTLALSDLNFSQALLEYRHQEHRKHMQMLRNKHLTTNSNAPILENDLSRNKAWHLIQAVTAAKQCMNAAHVASNNACTLTTSLKRWQAFTPDQRKQALLQQLDNSANEATDISNLSTWLQSLRHLVKLSFSHLVAHPNLLPTESLRFFHIDPNWLDAMVQGAISLGIHSACDEKITSNLFTQLKAAFTKTDPVCGLLIHSKLVTAWPGLAIRATGAQDSDVIKAMRFEYLADNLLLCLWPRVPASIVIAEPQEQLCFGYESDGFIQVRSLAKETLGKPIPGTKIPSVSQYWRTFESSEQKSETRILNLKGWNNKQNGLIPTLELKLPSHKPIKPADLAIQLLRAPEAIQFKLPHANAMTSMLAAETKEEISFSAVVSTTPYPVAISDLSDLNNPIYNSVSVSISLQNDNLSTQIGKFRIKVPCGDEKKDLFDGKVLTVQPKSITASTTLDNQYWEITDNHTNIISFIALDNAPAIDNSSFTIDLTGIQVNGKIGTLNIECQIYAPGQHKPSQVLPLSITKSRGKFTLNSLVANPPNVEYGKQVTLFWEIVREKGYQVYLSYPGHEQDHRPPIASTDWIDVTNYDSYPPQYSKVLMLGAELPQPSPIIESVLGAQKKDNNLIIYWSNSGNMISKSIPQEDVKEIISLLPAVGKYSEDQKLIEKITAKYGLILILQEATTFNLTAYKVNSKLPVTSIPPCVVGVIQPEISNCKVRNVNGNEVSSVTLGSTIQLTWNATLIDHFDLFVDNDLRNPVLANISGNESSLTLVPQYSTTYVLRGYYGHDYVDQKFNLVEVIGLSIHPYAKFNGNEILLNPTRPEAYIYSNPQSLNWSIKVINLDRDSFTEKQEISFKDPIEIWNWCINSAGTAIYLAYMIWENNQTYLSILDLTASPIKVTTLPGIIDPSDITVNPAGTQLFVLSNKDNTVSVFNCSNNTLSFLQTIGVGSNPKKIVINSSGTKAYVVNYWGNSISVLNLQVDPIVVVTTIPVGKHPVDLAIHPSGTQAIAVNTDDNSVSVIDLKTNSVKQTINQVGHPTVAAFHPKGTQAYVGCNKNFLVLDINGNVATPYKIALAGTDPIIAVDPSGALAYVMNRVTWGGPSPGSNCQSISVINLNARPIDVSQIITTATGKNTSTSFSIAPVHPTRVYVTGDRGSGVLIFDKPMHVPNSLNLAADFDAKRDSQSHEEEKPSAPQFISKHDTKSSADLLRRFSLVTQRVRPVSIGQRKSHHTPPELRQSLSATEKKPEHALIIRRKSI